MMKVRKSRGLNTPCSGRQEKPLVATPQLPTQSELKVI
jgi:hypothetical protein